MDPRPDYHIQRVGRRMVRVTQAGYGTVAYNLKTLDDIIQVKSIHPDAEDAERLRVLEKAKAMIVGPYR